MQNPELELWRTVIAQAISDATFCMLRTNSGKLTSEIPVNRKSRGLERVFDFCAARDWLSWGGKDFREVCHLAGLDPDAVRDAAKKAMREFDGLFGDCYERLRIPARYRLKTETIQELAA